MSTNKTENYELHLWEPSDSFQRAEFNENFLKLDAAVRAVTGSYVGDGAVTRHVELGAPPVAVQIELHNGVRHNLSNSVFGGLALRDVPLADAAVILDATGFTLSMVSRNYMVNSMNQRYVFLAVFEGG